MWFLESLLQCHPDLLTLLARRHWSCCYHWKLIIQLALQLPTVLFLVNAAPLLKKEWNAVLSAGLEHFDYPLLFHRACTWPTLPAHYYPIDSFEINHAQ